MVFKSKTVSSNGNLVVKSVFINDVFCGYEISVLDDDLNVIRYISVTNSGNVDVF